MLKDSCIHYIYYLKRYREPQSHCLRMNTLWQLNGKSLLFAKALFLHLFTLLQHHSLAVSFYEDGAQRQLPFDLDLQKSRTRLGKIKNLLDFTFLHNRNIIIFTSARIHVLCTAALLNNHYAVLIISINPKHGSSDVICCWCISISY